MPAPVPIVYGGGRIGNQEPFVSDADMEAAFKILEAHGVKAIDSAQLYGKSEERLGKSKAGERFILHTKWRGGIPPGWATKENVVSSAKESVQKLGVKQVDIFYLHAPDAKTPIAETLAGVQEVYQLGLFKRFGLSNYVEEDVQAVYDHCKANGYVLPTVYQGNYNPVARKAETALLPTLRKLGIAYYAYSPIAGGLLTKTAEQIRAGAGRFQEGSMYRKLYDRPAIMAALAKWEAVAAQEGVARGELAYRWVACNAALRAELGDAMIIGASSLEQMTETLEWVAKGPLSEQACKAIDEIWEAVKDEAPLDNLRG